MLHLLDRIPQIGVIHVHDHTSVVRKPFLLPRDPSRGRMGRYLCSGARWRYFQETQG